MLNRPNWQTYYAGVGRYGTDLTYEKAAAWLDGLAVEDWGCGYGYARKYIKRYRGIDVGSPLADVTADLASYTSNAEGILLRHVLEHNYNWPQIAANMATSFRIRACCIFHVPLADGPETILFGEEQTVDCPVLNISREAFEKILMANDVQFEKESISTGSSPIGAETLYYCRKSAPVTAP